MVIVVAIIIMIVGIITVVEMTLFRVLHLQFIAERGICEVDVPHRSWECEERFVVLREELFLEANQER